jgi:mono/diheme cytochrome c family protein
VAEVPEHLLQRSRERRAALGLGGGDAGAPATPAPSSGVEKATAATPAATSAAPAAPAATTAKVSPAPAPEPAAPRRRPSVPMFVMPVLVMLPFWALLYAGAFGEREVHEETPLDIGRSLYASQGCGGCHGATGGGGVGPALADGEAVLTFPDPADHAAWIKGGTASVGTGNPYGDPNRPGGGRVAKGGMPAFANLSDEEIEAIVLYEREGL